MYQQHSMIGTTEIVIIICNIKQNTKRRPGRKQQIHQTIKMFFDKNVNERPRKLFFYINTFCYAFLLQFPFGLKLIL